MIASLLQNLTHRVDLEIQEWRSSNAANRDIAYGPIRKVMIAAGDHPARWSITLVAVGGGFSILGLFLPRSWFVEWLPQFSNADQINYFVSIWAIQATVAALVYPIVIAFVALLLQRLKSGKSVVHIYLSDSGAILSGLSALSLIVLMALQYMFVANVGSHVAYLWTSFDLIWLALNLGLSFFFLWRTFEFIRPSRRADAVRLYTSNVVWPNELKEHLSNFLYGTAISNSLVPGVSYGDSSDDDEPRVWLGLAGGMLSKNVVVHKAVPRNSLLVDVRFRLLGWAIASWLRRANKEVKKNRARQSSFAGIDPERPVIIFPVGPLQRYSGKVSLCSIQGDVSVSRIERALIGAAFRFSVKHKRTEIRATDVFDDIRSEAASAIQARETQRFEAAIDEFKALYDLLVEISKFTNDNGDLDNYVCIPSMHHSFERPVYEEWSRQLLDTFGTATDRLGVDQLFTKQLSYVVPHLLYRIMRSKSAPSTLVSHLIEVPPVLARRILEWWSRTVEQQGIVQHDICRGAVAQPPYFAIHENVLSTFVGSWESLRNDYFPPRRDDRTDWAELKRSAPFHEQHLYRTASILIDSINSGDLLGSDLFAEVVVNWHESLRLRLDFHGSFGYRRPERLATIELLERDWSEVRDILGIEYEGYVEERAPSSIFSGVLANLHTDVCCVLAFMLSIMSKQCADDASVSLRILKSILFNELPRHDSRTTLAAPVISSPDDLLVALVRQYSSNEGFRSGYNARIDNLVERLSALTERGMIPGRVYSGWGMSDLDSLTDGQVFVLTLYVRPEWNPLTSIEGLLSEWVLVDNTRFRRTVERFKHWKDALTSSRFLEYEEQFKALARQEEGRSFSDAIEHANSALDKILEYCSTLRSRMVDELDVSDDRLGDIRRWSESSAFGKSEGALAVSLYSIVTESREIYEPRSLTFRRLSKAEFTSPPLAQTASNEEGFYGRTVRDHVGMSVLGTTLQSLSIVDAEADSPEAYWEQLKHYSSIAAAESRTPILLIERRAVPRWLYEWTRPTGAMAKDYSRPPDMVLSRSDERLGEGYVGNINQIAVYVAPIPSGSSIILTEESLVELTFSRSNGHYVEVEANVSESEPNLIDLTLTWRFALRVDEFECRRLTYNIEEK